MELEIKIRNLSENDGILSGDWTPGIGWENAFLHAFLPINSDYVDVASMIANHFEHQDRFVSVDQCENRAEEDRSSGWFVATEDSPFKSAEKNEVKGEK